MNVGLVLMMSLAFLLLGCNPSSNSDNADKVLEKEVQNYMLQLAEKDKVPHEDISVNIDTINDLERLNIYWAINCVEHEEFILEYNTMLLREMDSEIVNQIDSVILEVELPNSNFGLKRYRTSKQGLENLKKEYRSVDDKYADLLHYMMREEKIETNYFFDEVVEQSRLKDLSYIDTSYWTQGSFLNYLKTDFYVDVQDPKKHEAAIYLFKYVFGDASFFFLTTKALETLNYILLQDNQSPIEFTLEDTVKYGLRPSWL